MAGDARLNGGRPAITGISVFGPGGWAPGSGASGAGRGTCGGFPVARMVPAALRNQGLIVPTPGQDPVRCPASTPVILAQSYQGHKMGW